MLLLSEFGIKEEIIFCRKLLDTYSGVYCVALSLALHNGLKEKDSAIFLSIIKGRQINFEDK